MIRPHLQQTLKEGIRAALRLCGYEIQRYQPLTQFSEVRGQLLRRHRVQCVIDAGANVGAYGRQLRDQGYRGRILSIEPQAAAFSALREETANDPLWDCIRCALGNAGANGKTMTLSVARNSVSSSLLPMSGELERLFPTASLSHAETVEVRSLDAILQAGPLRNQAVFLKLDVQGYEDHVLAGAEETLRHTAAIQLELAIQPLYEGAQPMAAMINKLEAQGYVIAAILPNTYHPATGQLLEVDALFERAL